MASLAEMGPWMADQKSVEGAGEKRAEESEVAGLRSGGVAGWRGRCGPIVLLVLLRLGVVR